MTFRFDLPDTIALFTLPGALLLPRARIPLHIFEPRYLTMVDDCLKTDHRLIGVMQSYKSRKDKVILYHIGCAGRLMQFSETDNGRYMITLEGVSRFRLLSRVDTTSSYLMGKINWENFKHDLGEVETDEHLDREALLRNLTRYFTLEKLSADWSNLQEASNEMLINALSMLCPFEAEEKQALLEAPTLVARRKTLLTLIDFVLHRPEGGNVIQ